MAAELTQETVRDCAARIYAWYRVDSNCEDVMPAEFDRLHEIAINVYCVDARICLDADSDEEAAERMYETMRAKFLRSPPGPPWAELPDDSPPKEHYRARAAAGRAG